LTTHAINARGFFGTAYRRPRLPKQVHDFIAGCPTTRTSLPLRGAAALPHRCHAIRDETADKFHRPNERLKNLQPNLVATAQLLSTLLA
jgi:hypothetical protein